METRRPENVQVASAIVEFKDKGCKDDVLKLAKEDLELGYPKELVALYAEAGWQADRCRKFSSIMRVNSDGDLLRILAEGSFNPYQMQLMANFYDKGVTVQQLADVGSKGLAAYDMEQALKLVHQANKEAGAAMDTPDVKAAQEKEDSMAEALRQREKELEEQQETNNKQASENAALREKIEGLEKRVWEMEQEKAGHESEKHSILEERDRFYRQNQILLEEKEQLIAELEEVQKEKDELEQKLKGKEDKEMAQIAGQSSISGQQITGRQQDDGSVRRAAKQPPVGATVPGQQGAGRENESSGDMGNHDFVAAIKGRNGKTHFIPVERASRRKQGGIRAFADKILSRGRQDSKMIRQLTGKGLNPAQMEQVRLAVQAGLSGKEVDDLIDSGFSAEEMAQAIEIVVAEKAYQ